MKKPFRFISLTLLIMLISLGLAACGSDNGTPTLAGVPATTVISTLTATSVPATTQSAISTTQPAPDTSTSSATLPPALPTLPPIKATTGAAATTPTQGGNLQTIQAIRSTDWWAAFKANPDITITDGIDRDQKYIAGGGQNGFNGIPVVDKIVYVDMDGDGVEEAALPLFSGGTAGNTGFVVFRYAKPYPQIAAYQDGYKLGLEKQNNRLVMLQAVYIGWEGNCCPSGTSYTTYSLVNNQLKVLAHRSEGRDGTRADTVSYFYSLLQDKKLDEAYKLLDASYQKANPFKAWSAGYANTVKVSAEATEDSPGQSVKVVITSQDKGQASPKKFSGSWKVTWDSANDGWRLSQPNIKEVTAG